MGRVGGMFTFWVICRVWVALALGALVGFEEVPIRWRVYLVDTMYEYITVRVDNTFARYRMARLALLLECGEHGCAFTFILDMTSLSSKQSQY